MSCSVTEAVERIVADIDACPVERVALLDALGQVLATAIVSRITLPAWDNAAMDGYAVRADNVARASAEAPAILQVLETVPPVGSRRSMSDPAPRLAS